LILGAIGAMWEQARREHFPRVRREAQAVFEIGGKPTPVELVNLSIGGALVRTKSGICESVRGGSGRLLVEALGRTFPALDVVIRRTEWRDGAMQIGLEFAKPD